MSVAFVSSPIFTRHFSPVDYGNYTLVFITFNYLSIVTLTWISSCFWRFYPKYRDTDKIKHLYSSILYLIMAAFLFIFIFSIILYYRYTDIQIKRLVLFAGLNVVTNEILNIINIPIRYEGRARFYNTVNIVKSLTAFSILIVLTFILGQGIESFLISSSFVNIVLIVIIIMLIKGREWFRPLKPDLVLIKEVFNYGKMGMIANIGLLILINSDRYLIGIYYNKDSVGIYNQLYNLAQLSVASVINIFFAAVNPVYLNILENVRKERNLITAKYYALFSLVLIPVTVYFSLFTNEICHIMLGERFRFGQSYLPAIMFSSLLYGYALFHETRLKFNDKIVKVLLGTLFAGLLNLVLNFIVLPGRNYFYASITTFVSYLFLFIYLFLHDNFRIHDLIRFKNIYIRIIGILVAEILIYYVIKRHIGLNEIHIGFSIVEGMVFSFIYFIIIYFSRPFKLLMESLKLQH